MTETSLKQFADITKRLAETPVSDETFTPLAKEVLDSLKDIARNNPNLARYRTVRERMGKGSPIAISDANFPYRVKSA